MRFEWSAECAADDPVLVVPWSDPTGTVRFIDLRDDPYAAEDIPEAESHPPLLQALRALNAPRSPLFTVKCEAWSTSQRSELDDLCLHLDLGPEEAHAGFTSYIDLLWRDRTIFASFHQHEHLLHRLARRIALLDHPFSLIDCVIRPALLDLEGPQEGFATTLYVKALGADEKAALVNWGAALQAVVAILRSRDLTPNT